MSDDPRFVEHIKQVLDKSANQLDADVNQRLKLARLNALRQANVDKPTGDIRFWQKKGYAWGLGLTAALVLVVSITVTWHMNNSLLFSDDLYVDRNNLQQEYALEMLTSEETPEFYDEMEFYQWLSEKEAQNAT